VRLPAGWALVGFVALLLAAILGVQWADDGYLRTLLALALINVMLAVSLTLTNGFTGLFSLGHPAFMTIGAYVAVVLTYPGRRKGFMMPELPDWLMGLEWPLWPALLVAGFAAGVMALLVGLSVLRLRTHYLAVATLGLIIIVEGLAVNLDGITRGGRGINGIPRIADLWTVGACCLLAVVVAWRLKHASLGRAMLAVRENEMAARCFGIDPFRLKVMAFVIGAVFAGLGGALIPHVIAVLTPGSFGILLAFNLVAVVVVGGQGSIVGAVLISLAISIVTEFIRPLEETTQLFGLTQILIAGALIVVLLWRPRGLFGVGEPLIDPGRRFR